MTGLRSFHCSTCAATLTLPATADQRAYHWRITPAGHSTMCPPCLLAIGRVQGIPKSRASRAQYTGHTVSMTGSTSDTGISGVVSTGVTSNLLLPGIESLYPDAHEMPGRGVGGVGEEGLSQRRDTIPESLREFDALLRTHKRRAPTRNSRRRYEPNAKYWQHISERFLNTPGIDFTDEAEHMLEWMAEHPDRTTNICRFSVNWLTIAQERAIKHARATGNRVNGRYSGQQTAGRQYNMGANNLPNDVRQSAAEMDRRGRGE